MRILITVLIAFGAAGCTYYVRDDAPMAMREYRGGGACGGGAIGIALGRGPGHRMIVDRVAPNGPAADADIRPGDRLLAIDGELTRDMSLREAAYLIRGRADTAVELRVRSPRGPRLITLVRVPATEVWGASCERRATEADEGGESDAPPRD